MARTLLTEKLNLLRQDILAMATKVEEAIGKALAALRTCNVELANEVRADDAEVDAMLIRIEDDAATILATQQPVARDLRELVTIFKLTSNIERAGDHAVHLARAARKLTKAGKSPFRAQMHLERMAETGIVMMRSAISAYLSRDAEAARAAAAMDIQIDLEDKALRDDIKKAIKKDSSLVKGGLQILRTSNQLERLGDHVTNMCEAIIYMVEGKHEALNE
ncbi:MAG: phosphate signaling complex protein PhoU [Treponema sp.]|jgi:phosphate transport system protein|nr:phosphate signaling complex protein PhoU [Treponema sp.]